jgi:hypothetical protein
MCCSDCILNPFQHIDLVLLWSTWSPIMWGNIGGSTFNQSIVPQYDFMCVGLWQV